MANKKPITKEQKKYYRYLHDHFDRIEDFRDKIAGNKKKDIKGLIDKKVLDKLDFDKLYKGDKKYIKQLKRRIERFIADDVVDQAAKIGEDRAVRFLRLFAKK